MERPKLAPKRKRPRRVARKFADRFGLAHHRDVPASLHCLYCSPDPVLDGWPDDAQPLLEGLTRSGHLRGLASHGRTPCWDPHLWPGQPTPDGTARIDSVRITGDTHGVTTCTVTKTTPLYSGLDMSVDGRDWGHLDMRSGLARFAELHREIMAGPSEPAPDTILLPDTPAARAAAEAIDYLNEQRGSPKRSRTVDLEMTTGGVRVFRPETVKRVYE